MVLVSKRILCKAMINVHPFAPPHVWVAICANIYKSKPGKKFERIFRS